MSELNWVYRRRTRTRSHDSCAWRAARYRLNQGANVRNASISLARWALVPMSILGAMQSEEVPGYDAVYWRTPQSTILHYSFTAPRGGGREAPL